MSKDDMAKLKTLCLPFSISVSVIKCLQDYNSSLKLRSSTSPTMSSSSILHAPNPICVPCWVFLCWCKEWEPGNSAWRSLYLCVIECLGTLCFLATWYLKSSWDNVEKLGHWVQYKGPAEHLFLWREMFILVTWVTQCSQETFSLRVWEGNFVINRMIWSERNIFSNLIVAMQKK